MSIFTYFTKKRREQRRKLKELKAFASRFSTLDRLEQSGLLTFDAKQRRLFIAQSLAVLMMRDAESWVNFITNVYQWLYYQQAQEAWNAHFLQAELKAVREASVLPLSRGSRRGSEQADIAGNQTTPNPSYSGGETASPLSRADVERIRIAARQQVAESDIEPPKVEPFEMFVVEDTVDAKPRIIAVGYFNPETNDMEIAPWSEVEPLLKASADKQ
jgi:hypothetical protein